MGKTKDINNIKPSKDDDIEEVKRIVKIVTKTKNRIKEIKKKMEKEKEKNKNLIIDNQDNIKSALYPNIAKYNKVAIIFEIDKEDKLMEIRTEILRFNKLLELIEFFLSKYDNAEKYLRKRVKEHKEEDLKN